MGKRMGSLVAPAKAEQSKLLCRSNRSIISVLSVDKLNEFSVLGIQEGEDEAANALREWISN